MAQKSNPTTFTKGMVSDNDPRYQEPGTYRDAQNIQLINSEGSTFTVENINGNILTLDIVNTTITIENTETFNTYWQGGAIAWPFQNAVFSRTAGYFANIVGYYSYNNTLLLIIVGITDESVDNQDFKTIFLSIEFNNIGEIDKITDLKVAWEESEYNGAVVTNTHPNLNMRPETSVQVEGIVENECLNRIYFTDNVNPLRTINLLNKSLYSLKPDELNITPKADMNQPVLNSILSGRLPVGVYQYAFKYVNDNGAETGMSPLSNLMHISNQSSSSFKSYFGGPKGQISGDGFSIRIFDIDQDYDNIELYALLWESLDIPPIVAKVSKRAISSNQITFKHTNFENIIENGLEDVLIRSNTWDVCKDIAIKDNILFAANLRQNQNYITEKEWNVVLLRFNQDGNRARITCDFGEDIKNYYIDHSSGELVGFTEQTIGNVTYSTGAIGVDITANRADGFGVYDNSGNYLYADGAHRYLGQKPVIGGVQRNVLGGESYDFANNQLGGCRVTFALKRKMADTRYNNGGVMTTTTYIDANEPATDLETDNIAGSNDPTSITNVTNGSTVYRSTLSFSGSKDPQIAGSFRGYQRGETYRFGVLTYDLNGNPGNVLWISDLQMPNHYDAHYELDLDSHVLGSPAGVAHMKEHSHTEDYRLSISGAEPVPNMKRHYDPQRYDGSTTSVLSGQRAGYRPPGDRADHHLFDLHVNFEFRIPQSVRNKISGFRVVRAERNEEDRTIIQQGLYNLTNRYGVPPSTSEARKKGYKTETNLNDTLELDHIQEQINTPAEAVSVAYDDLLNGFHGLDLTSEKAESFDNTADLTNYFKEGDKRDTRDEDDFDGGTQTEPFGRCHYGGSHEFSWTRFDGSSNSNVFDPSYQFLNYVGTIDCPDSAFGIRPYQYRDGDRLRVDSILKLHNTNNLTGENHLRAGTVTNRDDSVEFSGIKETDTDKNSGIIINKFSVYDTYFNCYVQALANQNLTVRAYADKGYTDDGQSNSGKNYYPLTSSSAVGSTNAISQVVSITKSKEITAGEIISSSFFEKGTLASDSNGFSNHSLGFVRRNGLQGPNLFGILDENITKDEVEYDNVSTIQTGTRSIIVETQLPTIIRNVKKILTEQTFAGPQANSNNANFHYQKIPYKYLCSIVRQNEGQYGGSNKDAIYDTLYIPAGNFHRVSSDNDEENHLSRVAGGDTFVNFYSHQKSISPFSDKSYSTWNVFPVESYVNTDMRSGLHLAAGDTEEGFDLSAAPFTNDWLYNDVYSQENNLQRYLAIQEEGCRFIELPFEVAYSETKLSGETADAFRTFPIFNFHDVEAAYGQINNLFNFQNEIYFIQDKGFGKLLVNPRTFIADESQGTSLFTGTGETIESHTYISTQYGTRHQSSLLTTEDSIYFVDVSSRKIISFNDNTISVLSDAKGIKNKIDEYLLDNPQINDTAIGNLVGRERLHRADLPLDFDGISTGYDPIKRDVIFTFKSEKIRTAGGAVRKIDAEGYPSGYLNLIYNENIAAFTTKWGVAPQQWILHMDKLYTPRRRASFLTTITNDNPQGYAHGPLELWQWGKHPLDAQNAGKTHFYYDEIPTLTTPAAYATAVEPQIDANVLIQDSKITHVINDASLDTKIFDNMQIIKTGSQLSFTNFKTDIVGEQQQIILTPDITPLGRGKYREGILRFNLRGNPINTNPGNFTQRMRGTYLENTVTAKTKEKFNIFAILAKFRKSYN